MKLLPALLLFVSFSAAFAQQTDTTSQSKQFMYVIKLAEKYWQDSAWDDEANKTIGIHFKHLQEMLAEGKLILAGRTQDIELSKTMGICIFEASSFEEAKKIANNDPAVKAGIMTVEVFPYKVALMRK